MVSGELYGKLCLPRKAYGILCCRGPCILSQYSARVSLIVPNAMTKVLGNLPFHVIMVTCPPCPQEREKYAANMPHYASHRPHYQPTSIFSLIPQAREAYSTIVLSVYRIGASLYLSRRPTDTRFLATMPSKMKRTVSVRRRHSTQKFSSMFSCLRSYSTLATACVGSRYGGV